MKGAAKRRNKQKERDTELMEEKKHNCGRMKTLIKEEGVEMKKLVLGRKE